MKIPRPIKGEKVKWQEYNVVVAIVKVRAKIAKIKPDYGTGSTMPYQYFWVSFNEIGY